MNGLLLLGAAAATVATCTHGVLGHRWLRAQLDAVQLPPSGLFGDADVGRRILVTSWHVVTALFVVTGAGLLLLALQEREPQELLTFLSVLFVVVLLVGLGLMARRPDAWLRPVPVVFALCMTTLAVTTGWVAR